MKIYANRGDISSLIRYAGNDLWVEVISKRTHRFLYINILHVSDDGKMIYRNFPSDEIEYIKEKIAHGPFEYVYKHIFTVYNTSVDNFVVLEPIDVLSTDELLEVIATPEDIETIKKYIPEFNAKYGI